MEDPIQCDGCEMKRLRLSLSTSLQHSTGFFCNDCKSKTPVCRSCDSSNVRADADFGYDYESCYDCGYTIESITDVDKIPARLKGVMSEEAMAFIDAPENRETTIWIKKVKV